MTISLSVFELLASRICHDLISPVGAVHNGVEFLEEMGAGENEAIELISHSAQQASAKLQAFRLAYGAGGRDPNIKLENVYNTFDDLVSGDGKIKQTWDPHAQIGPETLPPGFCKILMGVLMLMQESLARGGTVTVTNADTPDGVFIVAEGEGAALRPDVIQALKMDIDTDALDPRTIHPYIMSSLASSYGFWLEVAEESENKIVLSLKILS